MSNNDGVPVHLPLHIDGSSYWLISVIHIDPSSSGTVVPAVIIIPVGLGLPVPVVGVSATGVRASVIA